MSIFGRRKSAPVPGKIETVIGRSVTLKGRVEFNGGLHLDGRVEGDVCGSGAGAEATLWIGADSSIVGNVEVANVVINGEVTGEVRARERVVLGEKARVTGDVYYGAIEMTLGARVDGKLFPSSATVEPKRLGLDPPSEDHGRPAGEFSLQPFDARDPRT